MDSSRAACRTLSASGDNPDDDKYIAAAVEGRAVLVGVRSPDLIEVGAALRTQARTYDMLPCGVRKEGRVATSTRRRNSSTGRRSLRARVTISGARGTRTGKVRKAFWLDPRLLDEARASLGASSEREAVEMALGLVGFRKELVRGARALRGLTLSRID